MDSIAVRTSCSNSFMLRRMHELKRVVVVGAGTMGSQIALQTALSGRYDVGLVDTVAGQLDKASAQNRKLLNRSVEKGRLTADRADAAFGSIKTSGYLDTAVRDADLVIEAVIEGIAVSASSRARSRRRRRRCVSSKTATLPPRTSTSPCRRA